MNNIFFIGCIISILIILYYNYKNNLNNTNLNKKEKKYINGGNERNKLKYGIRYFLYNHVKDIKDDGHIAGTCGYWKTDECGFNSIFQLYSLQSPQIKTTPENHTFILQPLDPTKTNVEYGDMFWITMTGTSNSFHLLNCEGDNVSISKVNKTTYQNNSKKYNGSLFEIISPIKTTGQVMKNDRFYLKLKNGKYIGKGEFISEYTNKKMGINVNRNEEKTSSLISDRIEQKTAPVRHSETDKHGKKCNITRLKIKYGISTVTDYSITNNVWSLIEVIEPLTTINNDYFNKDLRKTKKIEDAKQIQIPQSYFGLQEGGAPIILKNITQDFYDVTHISNFVDSDFNYNEFELSFSINRVTKMITDLDGGILTMGTNNANYHNLFIYLKKTELIVGLMGYNTHISINLNEINDSVSMYFIFTYKNPYLNVYVTATNKDNIIKKGYLDFLGNLSDKANSDFRLFLHPFLNSWCSIGTVDFVKVTENTGPNLLSASGILNSEETTMQNLIISHIKRKKKEIHNQANLGSGTKNYAVQHNIKNIIAFYLKFISGSEGSGKLIRMITQNNDMLELMKFTLEESDTPEEDDSPEGGDSLEGGNTYIMLSLHKNSVITDLIKIKYNKIIDTCYIELIPYMDLHLFCIYLNNDFYRYVIDLSKLREHESYLKDISINESDIALIDEVKIYTEEFKFISGQRIVKLNPTIRNKKGVLGIDFETNTKIEYIKPLSNNNIIYSLSIRNPFEDPTNMWKNILTLDLNKENKFRFKDENIIINDNRISNKYKLELTTNKYSLFPRYILKQINGNFIISGKANKTKMLNYVDDIDQGKGKGKIKLDDIGNTKWIVEYIIKNNFEIKTIIEVGSDPTERVFFKESDFTIKYFIIEGHTTVKDAFYIAYEKNKTKKYIYYDEGTEGTDSGGLKSKSDKQNCEFKMKPFNPLTITDSLDDIIELYGIENPFPKLYLDNNNIEKSTQPCSYVHSEENIIFSHLPSKIITMDKKDDTFDMKIQKEKEEEEKDEVPNCEGAGILCDIIKGNMYENENNKLVNKIYNFCSNNLEHYENKLYSYKYDRDRYYYQENNDNNYNNKERVTLKELSELELKQALSIKRLRDGVDLINVKNNLKLNNVQFGDIYNIYSNDIKKFKIDWGTSAFKSGVLIHLEGGVRVGVDKTTETTNIKTLKIIETVFNDKSMKPYMDNMKTNLKEKFKKTLKEIKKDKKFFLLSLWGEKAKPLVPCPTEDYDYSNKAPKSCCDEEDKCDVIDLVTYKPPVCAPITIDSVKKRITTSKDRILMYINKLIKSYGNSPQYIDLKMWPNLYDFIYDNYTDDEIRNTKGVLTYLFWSHYITGLIKIQRKNMKSWRSIMIKRSKRRTFGGGNKKRIQEALGFAKQLSTLEEGALYLKNNTNYTVLSKSNHKDILHKLKIATMTLKKVVLAKLSSAGPEETKLLLSTKVNIFNFSKKLKMIENVEKKNTSINGGDSTPVISSFYKKYTKNPDKFIEKIVNEIIEMEDNRIDEEDTGYETLLDLYVDKMVPIVEYQKNTPPLSNSWKLEWGGFYDSETTEFQLYNINEGKYLVFDNKNGVDSVVWSDVLKWGAGWKIKPSSDVDVSETAEEIYKKKTKFNTDIKKQIYSELRNTYFQEIISDIITKTNSDTKTAEVEHAKNFEKQIDDNRKKDIISLNTNAWLFSPNIGKNGSYLIPTPNDKKIEQNWMDFGGRPFDKYKFKFMSWGENGAVSDKVFDNTNSTIVISRTRKSQDEYLKNKLNPSTNAFEWTTTWSNDLKWTLEWDTKLEINLNTIEVPQPLPGETEILSRYKLIENKQATITVGKRITELNGISWVNEFMAVSDAEDKQKYGCIDYSWISEENGKAVYYDDDYSTQGTKNTVTRAWCVLDRERSVTEQYFAVTKLRYELNYAKNYNYSKCTRSSWGRCRRRSYYNWANHGSFQGMLIWKGNIQNNPAPTSWDTRREDMLKELDSTAGECIIKKNKPMFVYLKSPRLGYLRSNNIGIPKFSKSKPKSHINGWYLLMKYKTQKPQWLIDNKNLINTYPNNSILIKKNVYCDHAGSLFKKGADKYGHTLEECADAVREWQLTNGEEFKWFQYRAGPKNTWSGKHRCYASKTKTGCINELGRSGLKIDTGHNGKGSEFSFYKLDDNY